MCLMARRGRDRDIPHTDLTAIIFGSEEQAVTWPSVHALSQESIEIFEALIARKYYQVRIVE